MAHLAAQAVLHLLRLPCDDPQLVQLAAAAVLMGEQEGSVGPHWSNAEMSAKVEGVLRMQERSYSLPDAHPGLCCAEQLEAAALIAVFEQLREAVRKGRPLPQRKELLVGAARSLLQRDFDDVWEVEAAVASELLGGARPSFAGGMAPCTAALGVMA